MFKKILVAFGGAMVSSEAMQIALARASVPVMSCEIPYV